MVLQRYEGMNIAREKPITVKNPQSTKQTDQRAKFKLASQIVAEFNDVFNVRLSPLSIYKRTKRGAAVNAIIGVTNSTNPSTPKALFESVLSAINAKSVSGNNAVSVASATEQFTIESITGYTVIYTHCGYDSEGKLTYKATETYTSTGENKNVAYVGADREVIIATAFIALTESGRATISNVTFDTTANIEGWTNAISRSINAGDIEVANLSGDYRTA